MTAELNAFRAIVGVANVFGPDDPRLGDYTDPFAFDDTSAHGPAGVVLPVTVEEVKAVVRAANEFGVGLWTVSRGRNLGYGAAAPRDAASVVLDLHRMDRILEVNVEAGYVVVEPGVSFFALYEYLQSRDIPLWTSVPDLGGGSVLGNALERGFGYTAYGQHGENLCGMEVVLPSGELIRTGMGALAGSAEAHTYRGGFGPSLDGLFQQSNLGVVTRVGVWLMPRPESAAACLVSVDDPDELAALVDTIRPLMLERTIDSVVIVGNALAIASQIMPRSAVYSGDGPMPQEAVRAIAAKLGVGLWNAKFGVYGPPAVVEAKLAVIRAAVAALPGGRMEARMYSGGVTAAEAHPADRAQLGIPSGDLIQMAAWRGGVPAHTDFSLVAPTTGADAQRLAELVRRVVEAHGLEHAGGFTMFGRHAIMLSLISFDASDADERVRVNALFSELLRTCAEAGYAPYRAHPAFMDRIADLYGFNDRALARAVTTIKDALDPGRVLSPGKQGIWGTAH